MNLVPDDLISLAEAGEILGISREWAHELARRGEFPGGAAVRVSPRRWKVSVPKLDRYLHGEAS